MINWNSKSIHLQKTFSELDLTIHLSLGELCDILYKLDEEAMREIIIEVLNNSSKDFWKKIKESVDENN